MLPLWLSFWDWGCGLDGHSFKRSKVKFDFEASSAVSVLQVPGYKERVWQPRIILLGGAVWKDDMDLLC